MERRSGKWLRSTLVRLRTVSPAPNSGELISSLPVRGIPLLVLFPIPFLLPALCPGPWGVSFVPSQVQQR